MISLAKISSNKDMKRPVIVVFLNSSGVVWTTAPTLPRLPAKSIVRRRSSMSPKRKKSEEVPAKEKCPINKLHKQNKYLGAERTSIKFNIRYFLLALSRRLTRWPNKVLLYLLLLSDLSGGTWNTFKKNS